MDKLDTLFYILGPLLILLGSFMVWKFDKKKVKTNPLIGLYKILANLTNDYPKNEVLLHDKFYYPHNKKMERLIILGWIFILVGTILLILAPINFSS